MNISVRDKRYVQKAVRLARRSVAEGGFPAGALVVKDSKVISEGISIGFELHDPTSHAETASIRKACQELKTLDLKGAILYESLECCLMCFSVAYWAGISKIIYACRKTPEMVNKFYYEGFSDNNKINKENNRNIELIFIPDFERESLGIVREWEKKFGGLAK